MNAKHIVSILVFISGLLIATAAQASETWVIVGTDTDGIQPDLIGTVTTSDIPVNCTGSPSTCDVSGTLMFAATALGGPGTTFDLASDPGTVTVSISDSPPAAGDNFNLFIMTRDGYFCDGSASFTLECEYNFENTTEFVLELAPPSVAIGNGNVLITGQFLANGQPINLPPKQYSIGDRGPANGWVFYVTDDGLHGLEAAPGDQYSVAWGCAGTYIVGAEPVGIGTGASNTEAIIQGCDTLSAARVTAEWVSPNGYLDWYLPSLDELDLMYDKIGNGNTTDPNVGGFANAYYWSSTERGPDDAWMEYFLNGDQEAFNKDSAFNVNVRAVRTF